MICQRKLPFRSILGYTYASAVVSFASSVRSAPADRRVNTHASLYKDRSQHTTEWARAGQDGSEYRGVAINLTQSRDQLIDQSLA